LGDDILHGRCNVLIFGTGHALVVPEAEHPWTLLQKTYGIEAKAQFVNGS